MDIPPRLSIIVVSYNTRELTLEALRSAIRETRNTPFELLVVDNHSSDGSAEAIAQAFPQARLFALQENLGFAAANNLAAASARGERLLLLNPDTVTLDAAIDRLMAFADAHPEAQIWGGRTLFGDRRLNPTSSWRHMNLWSLFSYALLLTALFKRSELFDYEGYGGWQHDRERQVDIVSGCFFLLPRTLWERLGGFDPTFYMYAEEADLCLRALPLGARPMETPTATIIHYGGQSEAHLHGMFIKLFAAKVTLMRHHWSPPAQRLGVALLKLATLLRSQFAFPLAARLRRSDSLRHKAQEWRKVWERRAEWERGFPERLRGG